MKIRRNPLLLFFITTVMLSCQKPSLDDLSIRLSKSEAFIEWHNFLADPPKRIGTTDAKKLALQNRYKRAGFQMIIDTYTKNSFPRKNSLQVQDSGYSAENRVRFMKWSLALQKVIKEFPEINKLSREDRSFVLKKAFMLLRKADKKNPAFTTRDRSIKN